MRSSRPIVWPSFRFPPINLLVVWPSPEMVRVNTLLKTYERSMNMSALDTQEGGSHYKDLPIQPVEYITKNKIPFIEGCIIKYATRHRYKNGTEDVKKIIHFAKLLLELEYPTK